MGTRETQLICDQRVIHTQYHGEIDCAEILSAIDEWCALIEANAQIQILIFDYMDASMAPLSKNDVMRIAEKTALLTRNRSALIMIGVVPSALDAGLTNMWRAYSNLDAAVPDEQMHVTRNLADALAKVEQLLV